MNDINNTLDNFSVIKCPHCGAEYLPCEIFYPKSLLGCPEHIVRTPLGKILIVEWKEDAKPSLEESFVCENCDHTFKVSMEFSYKSSVEDEVLDFNHPTVSLF